MHHMSRNSDTAAPQTISPEDVMLELREADGGADQMGKTMAEAGRAYAGMSIEGTDCLSLQVPAGMHVPQQHPFTAKPHQQSGSSPTAVTGGVSSEDTTPANSTPATGSPQRPAAATAEGGTYTCTYHGCTLRFESPALLLKHKREGHRQAHGLNGTRRGDSGMTSTLLNSQAGPHRCDRINPSTRKPCNTIFSRPYDLTRHEDTIHNARKRKVRCGLCTEEKTFSRADALTRHYRVCHPEVEFSDKHRRRAGTAGAQATLGCCELAEGGS